MKRERVLILLLALVLIMGLSACTSETTNDGITGAIHRVEFGDNVAYLFGTFHAGRDDWFPLADVVEDALRSADVVAMEIEEIGMGARVFRQAGTSVSHLPNGLTWSDYLPEDAYRHLVATLDSWDVSYENANTMNPIYLIVSLENHFTFSLSDIDASFDATVDAYIARKASDLELQIIGLESVEQQIEIAYNPPIDVAVAKIMSFLPPEEFIEAQFKRLTLDDLAGFYGANDFESIITNFARELSVDDDCLYAIYTKEHILSWRSTYYAHEIIRLLQETEEPTTFFVAVGIGHIISSGAGDEFTDIVQQLEVAGLEVMPLW